LNLRQLKYFVGVVDAGNMTRAAEQLHVAQTALGMQVRQLEEDLAVSLLVRHSRGIEPTQAGRLLYERAIRILELVADTRRDLAAHNSFSMENIRLGTTPALMAAIGPDIVVAAKERIPQVSLSMAEAMSHVLTGMLERKEVDFILGYDVPDEPQLIRKPLMQDDLFLVTKSDMSTSRTIDLSEALSEQLAMPEAGDTVRNAVARAASELGRELKVTYEVRSVAAMKTLVGRGVASSILPLFSVADEVQNGFLKAKHITSPAVRRTLYLASARQRARFRNVDGLAATIRESLEIMVKRLESVASKSWARLL